MKKIYIQPEVEIILINEALMDNPMGGGSVHNGPGQPTSEGIGNGGEGSDDDDVDAKGNFWEDDEYWVGL